MGNGDIIANMGVSVLLISIALILLIVIIFAGAYLAKKYAMSEKVREKLSELKQSMMYNPLIRYTMLNCLKWNNTGMVAFVGLATGNV